MWKVLSFPRSLSPLWKTVDGTHHAMNLLATSTGEEIKVQTSLTISVSLTTTQPSTSSVTTLVSTHHVIFPIPKLVVAICSNLTTIKFHQLSIGGSGTIAGVDLIHMLISAHMCSHTLAETVATTRMNSLLMKPGAKRLEPTVSVSKETGHQIAITKHNMVDVTKLSVKMTAL